MLEITDSPDVKQWSEFVYGHPYGNIFQTPEMAEVYKRTRNYEPISLAVVDDTDEILAILLAVVIKEMGGILGSFSARSIIQGGPLFVEGEKGIKALKLLMGHYDKIVQKKALYTEIRNMGDTSNISSFLNTMGYKYEEHLNFLVDLTKSTEEVWKQIHRSMRKNIKKAEKIGVEVEQMEDRLLLSSFYSFLMDVSRDAKKPLPDISFFEAIFDILVPKNMAKFYLAKNNGEYIGGRVSLVYKKVIYAYFVGVPKEYKHLGANPLLNWHVIAWGAENGYHTFDFGGAGKPNEEYGVREFKRQFGGRLVNYGRYKKIYSPIKMKIAERGFQFYRKLHFRG